jgi:hypothetical protein
MMELGSFIDVGAYDGAGGLFPGLPGLCIEPAPDAVDACARRFAGVPDVLTLAAALVDDAKRFHPLYWTVGAPDSSLVVRPPTAVPILVASVHPSDLYELWELLPEPRHVSVDIGLGSGALLRLLADWVRFERVRVALGPDGEEEAATREWLSTWRITADDGRRIEAER